jgi:hypothetical protein
VVAIHQPNFLPWLGYFSKILRADAFVFLDDVEYSHGSWTNRVRLAIGGQPHWITCPRRHPGRPATIREIEIDDSQNWRRKLIKTLQSNYARSSFFAPVFPWVAELVTETQGTLAEFNVTCIQTILSVLEIPTEIHLQSKLGIALSSGVQGSGMLARLVKHLEGQVYLSGDGADGYEDQTPYHSLGIELQRLGFVHPTYPRGKEEPMKGLSILDAFFHLGVSGTRKLLRGED